MMTHKHWGQLLCIALLLLLGACQKAPQITMTTPATIELSADGSSGTITFTANRDWTTSCSDSWVHVSPASGKMSKDPVTVSVRCDANTTYDDRSATVTIKAEDAVQTVTIRQPQNLGIVVPTQTFVLTSEARTIDVEVQANVEYSIEISEDWIQLPDTKSLSSTQYTFIIAENKTYDSRTATITVIPKSGNVQSQVISVKQAAKDGLELDKTIFDVAVSGGTLEIALRTNVEIEVKPGPDWIHYTQTKALENRTVVLLIDANNGTSARSGEVKISQKGGALSSTITVKQEKPVLTVGKTEYSINQDGGMLEIAVQTNVELEVKPKADWIHYTETTTKALDDKTVVLSIDPLDGMTGRRGTVKISQKGGALNVTVTVSQVGELVDLGLSVKWRARNLGATKPEEYGDYYAWGEVETKNNYDWSTYKWCNGGYNKITKYCPENKGDNWDGTGKPDGKTVLDLEDDAAHVVLGGNWRMPTDKEWSELRTQCTWTWTTWNGVNGCIVQSKSNGNSIFLPAAGYRYGTDLIFSVSDGFYWSSSLRGGSSWAWAEGFYSGGAHSGIQIRYDGLSVRPVSE